MRRRSRWILGIALALVAGLTLAWFGFVKNYFFNATFMAPQSGSSTTTLNGGCSAGQAQYFGYPLEAIHGLRVTGAELVGVPSTYTVDGIYAVNSEGNKFAVFGGGTEQAWDESGYDKAHLYPVTAVNTATDPYSWWLVAKVVPNKPGLNTIQGIRIYYKSGWRSGSVVYNEAVASNCS